jgi:hypothetical protein
MFNPKLRYILILVWVLLISIPAEAQTAGSAILEPPETTDFPIIQTYLEVYDVQGRFVHDLQEGDIRIIENQHRIPVLKLEELEAGVQFVVAVNLGPALAIRDSNGISRYSKVQVAIQDWASNHTHRHDDLSFLTNDSAEKIHLNDAARFLGNFQEYKTDPRSATPSLDVLVRAINVATDPVPRIGMGRALLFLTPHPNRTSAAAIQSIISLARQERIRVYVWMVSSPDLFISEGATLLVELANQTGGKFFAFSGTEDLPNIEGYLNPLRYVYSLSYESQIRNGDSHQISAEIKTNDLEIASQPQNFNLQVLPPNPMFLSPPFEVFRANRSTFSETLSEEAAYIPTEQPLEILVEFPDGLPRSLVRTVLYVDGEIADENSTPPFDRFKWDLNDYTTNSTHIIQVEAFDSLGLSGVSIENTVEITVQRTPQSVITTLAKNAPLIAGAAAAVAGGILILVLIVRGRIKPKAFGRRRLKKKGADYNDLDKKTAPQPISQDIPVQRRRISYWVNRFAWPKRASQPQKPIAYLEMFGEIKGNSQKLHIPISSDEITFGRDPKLATATFNDLSIEDLHARIRVNPQGEITIHDEGSTAGTWVNFSPISTEDVILSHGDIIHIGRIGLCLKLTDKNQIPKPVIRSQEHPS